MRFENSRLPKSYVFTEGADERTPEFEYAKYFIFGAKMRGQYYFTRAGLDCVQREKDCPKKTNYAAEYYRPPAYQAWAVAKTSGAHYQFHPSHHTERYPGVIYL